MLADNEGRSFGFGLFLIAGQVVAAFVQEHVRGFVNEGRGARGWTGYDFAGCVIHMGFFVETVLLAVSVAVGVCQFNQGCLYPVVPFLGAPV